MDTRVGAIIFGTNRIVIRSLLKTERTFWIGLQFSADVNAIKFLTFRAAFIKTESNLVAN